MGITPVHADLLGAAAHRAVATDTGDRTLLHFDVRRRLMTLTAETFRWVSPHENPMIFPTEPAIVVSESLAFFVSSQALERFKSCSNCHTGVA
jgi:hypothetical protein